MWLFTCSEADESKLIKLVISCTVILPQWWCSLDGPLSEKQNNKYAQGLDLSAYSVTCKTIFELICE